MFYYEYLRPETLDEACDLLAQYGSKSKVLAGGTDLLVQIRDKDEKLAALDYVIDISHIEGLSFIEKEDNRITIGSMTTHSEIYKSPLIKEWVSFLSDACGTVGSPQIRNRGTIGGGICNASPASDVITPLIALDAEATLLSKNGERKVLIKDLIEKAYRTQVGSDELLISIEFNILPEKSGYAFEKIGRRKALAISRMNIGVGVAWNEDGTILDLRIAPGCIFSQPERVTDCEQLFIGKKPTLDLIEEASQKASEVMIAKTGVRWSTEYKKPVVEALVRRNLKKLLEVSDENSNR